MTRPTIRTVAAEAGVSTATVSYVLSGRTKGSAAGVSDATAQRVRDAALHQGYRANQAARTIRTGRSNVLLLSLTMLADPWALAVSAAVRQAAAGQNLTAMILADTNWRTAIGEQNADVVFIDAADEPGDLAILRQLSATHQLVVFSDTLPAEGFDVIRSMAGTACGEAMAQLTHSHTRIAVLSPHRAETAGGSLRYRAYRDGLLRAGLSLRPDFHGYYNDTVVSPFQAAMTLLQLPDRPTAIFACSDFAGIAAIHAAGYLGLRVPEDVAVVGIGNTVEGELMTPALTTVGPVDFFDTLADFLVKRAQDPALPPETLEFPWQVLVRDSSRAPGADRRSTEQDSSEQNIIEQKEDAL